MWFHKQLSQSQLHNLLKDGSVQFAGNNKLKIYGRLRCASGKRMKVENRVFFHSENEALKSGFRPCGHCMKLKIRKI